MRKESYAEMKRCLHVYNEEIQKFFAKIYEYKKRERKKFQRRFAKTRKNIRHIRKTDGII